MRLGSNYPGFIAALFVSVNMGVLWAQTPANFVSVTPCRLVDTRKAAGPFGGPSVSAGSARSFPIPTSSCGIPSTASAYSLNVTVVPPGLLGYITMWPTGQAQPLVSTLNDQSGVVIANAAIVPSGTKGAISVFVSQTTDLVIDINGYFASPSDFATESTALGTGASTAGTQNTALGFNTLQVNSSGNGNTAAGSLSLASNTSGNNNVAIGSASMNFNATGSADTAVGSEALLNSLIGNDNTAVGFATLWSNTTGSNNTAIGVNALFSSTTGSANIGIGYEAGYQVTNGVDNIEIGSQGTAADSNAIRIGSPGVQMSAYIAGINGVIVGGGSSVLIDPTTGQLGVAASSARYKDDIRDMGAASDGILQLRPVTFRYKQASGDGTKPIQYGLIAEEVEKIYPELVVHGPDREVESVQYRELPALLLNEVQSQHKTIEELEARIAALEALLNKHPEK
ncbi:MAG: tail fiber domain-containing protein [Bryobacteraceae bacterium]